MCTCANCLAINYGNGQVSDREKYNRFGGGGPGLLTSDQSPSSSCSGIPTRSLVGFLGYVYTYQLSQLMRVHIRKYAEVVVTMETGGK